MPLPNENFKTSSSVFVNTAFSNPSPKNFLPGNPCNSKCELDGQSDTLPIAIMSSTSLV